MVRIVFGVMFIIGGINGVRTSGIASLLIGLVIGAVLIWSGYNAVKKKQAEKENVAEIAERSVMTFSFMPVGTRFECRTPGQFKSRQEVLAITRVGDRCALECYEWQGNPAIMVVSRRVGQDIGVVPAKLTGRVLDLMNQYDTDVEITKKDDFKIDGEEYDGCEAKIYCMERSGR